MNFLGFEKYQLLNQYTFPMIPNFHTEKKEYSYDSSKFQHAIYQFNISQIFQWIEYIESQSNINLSNDLFLISWEGKEKEFIKFLDKGKGILVETFGNTKLKFLKKICMECNDLPFFFNEYFIMVYGINFLRYKTPTFNFTYSLYKENKYISLKQEFNNGTTLDSFLKHCSKEDFISIFFQIILSLEVAQFNLLFTHYDLHTENILIEEIDTPFSIHYRNNVYEFKKYKIKMIDFSFSTATISPNSILSNCYIENLYSHGYYPFFTPGTDMFRILSDIFSQFYRKKDSFITDFCLSIYEKFYKISQEKINHFIPLLKSNYYNCSVLPIIYSTPLELFEFLEKEYKNKLPFEKKPFEHHPLTYQKEFKNIFSIETIQKNIPHNPLLGFYSSHKKNESLPFRIPKSSFPIFMIHHLEEIQRFYEQYSFFLDWFSITEENTEYHKFFRILYSLKEFLYFIHHPQFKVKEQDIERIKYYHSQVKDFI